MGGWIGLPATCDGSHGRVAVVAEGEGEHCSKFHSTLSGMERVAEPSSYAPMRFEPSPEPGGLPSSFHSQLPKHPFKELSCLPHMLLNIRLQMPRPRLPIVCRVADPACQEDKLV